MASLTLKLLSSLAAAIAAGSPAAALPEAQALELLSTARTVAERLTDCPATADDLVGETARKIVERRPGLVGAEGWRGYVRQAVRNAYRDELRRGGRRRITSLEDDGDQGDPLDRIAVETGSAGAFAEELAVEEFRESFDALEREVLELLVEGLSDRAIAEQLGQTRHAVRKSVERIRREAERVFGETALSSAFQG